MAHPLFVEGEEAEIRHALRIEDAVEMVELVLDDAGVNPGNGALDPLARRRDAPIAQARGARHRPAHSRDGETALPAELDLLADELDHRVDDGGEPDRLVAGTAGRALGGHA